MFSRVSDGQKDNSNQFKWKYGLKWSKGSDDPQKFNDQKGISIVSKDFENPKFYGDTSIFDGLVLIV